MLKHFTQKELDDLKMGNIVEIKIGSKWVPAIVIPSYYDKFVQFFTINKKGKLKAPRLLSGEYNSYWWNAHCYAIGVGRPDWIRSCSRTFKKDYRASS